MPKRDVSAGALRKLKERLLTGVPGGSVAPVRLVVVREPLRAALAH